MAKRSYPYKAWALTPSFKPKQIEIVNSYASYFHKDAWDVAASGKNYALTELFETEALAIAEGWRRVEAQQAKLDKMAESLAKKRKSLEVAEAA
jgi:hypothetical protein